MTKTRESRCLYLSGPMSGLPENNYPAFHAAAASLRRAGYRVVNPAELHPHGWCRRIMAHVFSALMRRAHHRPSWSEYMRADLAALLRCDAIVMLPGWEASKGARCEVSIASELGMARWSLAEAMGAQDYSHNAEVSQRAANDSRSPDVAAMRVGSGSWLGLSGGKSHDKIK